MRKEHLKKWLVLGCALALTWAAIACDDGDGGGGGEQDAHDAVADLPDGVSCTAPLLASAPWAEGVQSEVVGLGVYPNAVVIHGEHAYVVNSGDNAIQRFRTSPLGAQDDKAFVDLGSDKNPYDLAIYEDRIYITNLMEGSISVANLAGEVLNTVVLPELVSPQDIVATESYLFIANTEFTFPAPETRFGSLVVLERSDAPTLVNRIETSASNPQFLALVGEDLYVVNSGRVDYDFDSGAVTPAGEASVDLFPLATVATATGPEISLPLAAVGNVGNPGAPAWVGDYLFLGSGTFAGLFVIDVRTQAWVHDSANPLMLYAHEGNALLVPSAGPHGLVYVLDFNHDGLFVLDPSCMQVVSPRIALGAHGEFLEGPNAIAWSADGVGHVVLSVSGALATVTPAKWMRP